MNKNQKGFSPIEILMILVIVALIGIVGYLTYKNHHKAVAVVTVNKPAPAVAKTPSTSVAPNPYAGWKSSTLSQEKLSFKYPSTWTLKNMSDSYNDDVQLTGTNNFQMIVGAGADVSAVNFPFGGSNVVQADPVTFIGQPAYIDLWTDEGASSSSIYSMWLSQSSTQPHDFFPSKNITANASNSSVVVLMDYNAPNAASFTNESLSYVENDINYKEAKLLIESMSY